MRAVAMQYCGVIDCQVLFQAVEVVAVVSVAVRCEVVLRGAACVDDRVRSETFHVGEEGVTVVYPGCNCGKGDLSIPFPETFLGTIFASEFFAEYEIFWPKIA